MARTRFIALLLIGLLVMLSGCVGQNPPAAPPTQIGPEPAPGQTTQVDQPDKSPPEPAVPDIPAPSPPAVTPLPELIPPSPPPPPVEVVIRGGQFIPEKLLVDLGTTVTWTNQDKDVHTVYDALESFLCPQLNPGDSFSFTFTRGGAYYIYYCEVHGERGSVQVR